MDFSPDSFPVARSAPGNRAIPMKMAHMTSDSVVITVNFLVFMAYH
jgi:hypothetical protein